MSVFVIAGLVCQFGVRHKFVCSGESTAAAGGSLVCLSLVPSSCHRNHVRRPNREKGANEGAAP